MGWCDQVLGLMQVLGALFVCNSIAVLLTAMRSGLQHLGYSSHVLWSRGAVVRASTRRPSAAAVVGESGCSPSGSLRAEIGEGGMQ
jgi:hypothetical protein